MNSENQSSGFSWVKARATCSLLPVFKKLEMDVREDVKVLNGLQGGPLPLVDVAGNDAGTMFQVFRGSEARRTLSFVLHPDRIEITTEKSAFTVMLTLDDDCKCKLRILEDGKTVRVLEQWQVRRLVLEELFFNPA